MAVGPVEAGDAVDQVVDNDGREQRWLRDGKGMQPRWGPPRDRAGWEGVPAYIRSLMPALTSHQLTG